MESIYDIEKPYRMRGVVLDTPAAATKESTDISPTDTDGDIIGISANNPYDEVDAALILVSVTQGDNQPIIDVPVNQLTPKAGQPYFPVNLKRSGKITAVLDSKTANCAAATPIYLTFHFRKPANC